MDWQRIPIYLSDRAPAYCPICGERSNIAPGDWESRAVIACRTCGTRFQSLPTVVIIPVFHTDTLPHYCPVCGRRLHHLNAAEWEERMSARGWVPSSCEVQFNPLPTETLVALAARAGGNLATLLAEES